jgi:hypothetical protein
MRRVLGTPLIDYLPALVLWLLTAGYLATAYGYSAESRVVPVLVAWSMLVLLLLDLASRTQTPLGQTLTQWFNPAAAQAESTGSGHAVISKQLAAVLWLAGFTTLLLLIGVLYAVPLYVFASIRLRGRRSYLASLVVAAGMALTVWLLFGVLLRLQFYPGLLFGGD